MAIATPERMINPPNITKFVGVSPKKIKPKVVDPRGSSKITRETRVGERCLIAQLKLV
jgi:hypothetical protein